VVRVPAKEHRDYSATPLARKLGIRVGARVVVVDAPVGFVGSLAPLPDGVRLGTRATGSVDVGVAFAVARSRLERRAGPLVRALAIDGGLWFAWPKKASRVDTDLTFDIVQRIGLDAGLVDNKSASIDDVFQAMRFVYRLKDRPALRPGRR
jgi:hypothetical protein